MHHIALSLAPIITSAILLVSGMNLGFQDLTEPNDATADFPILTGRILNTEGIVGRNIELLTSIRSLKDGRLASRESEITTDFEGIFHLQLSSDYGQRLERTLTIFIRETKKKPLRLVEVNLDHALESGEYSLGDLIVDNAPILLTGFVFDDSGKRLSGARVAVKRVDHRSSAIAIGGGINGMDDQNTIVDGYFFFRGAPIPGQYQVYAAHQEFSQTSTVVSLGTLDVKLQLEALVTVKGSIRLDPGINPSGLELSFFTPSGSTAEKQRRYTARIDSQGRFRFENPPMGIGSIRLTYRPSTEILFSQDNITFASNQGDQILPDIDLRGKLTSGRLRVINMELEDLDGVWVNAPSMQSVWQLHRSNTRIIRHVDAPELEVGAPDYRNARIASPSKMTTLKLSPGIPVSLIIQGEDAIPESWHFSCHLSLHQEDENRDPEVKTEMERNAQGRHVGRVQSYGKYRVRFEVRFPASGGKFQLNTVEYDGSMLINVLNSADLQTYSFDFPLEAMQELSAGLEEL